MEDANRTTPYGPVPTATILSSLSGTLPARPTTRPRDPGTTFSELPVPSLQQRCTQRKFRANRRRLTSPFPDPSISSRPAPSPPPPMYPPDRVYISFIYRSSRRFPLALATELMSRGNGAGENLRQTRESSLGTFRTERSYASLFSAMILFQLGACRSISSIV